MLVRQRKPVPGLLRSAAPGRTARERGAGITVVNDFGGAPQQRVWSADDVLFADIRAAHLAPAAAVVSDLVAAAAEPRRRLAGVTPFEARMKVSAILREAGDWPGAVTVASQALQAAPKADLQQRFEAAATMTAAGAEVGTADLLAEALDAHHGRNTLSTFAHVTLLGLAFGESGRFGQAFQVIDELEAALESQSRGGRIPAVLQPSFMAITRQARQDLEDLQRDAAAAAVGPGDVDGMRTVRDKLRGEIRRRAAGRPPWPASVGPDLLWWPQADYDRIVSQVPDLRRVLGATWREHTTVVQSVLATAAGLAGGPARAAAPAWAGRSASLMLTTADFASFAGYLRTSRLDPRLATVMTDYTEHAAKAGSSGPPWPPGPNDRCWCGSRQKYRACCGAAA
jgi:hypothetical protein